MTVVAQLDHTQNPAEILTVVDYGDDTVPDEITEAIAATPPGWVDVTATTPRPGPGWTTPDNATFTQPTAQINQAAIQSKMANVLSQNAAFLLVPNPSAGAQLTQLKSLTAQVDYLIRTQTGDFSAQT
jgi:hypothetical protein